MTEQTINQISWNLESACAYLKKGNIPAALTILQTTWHMLPHNPGDTPTFLASVAIAHIEHLTSR